MGKIYKALVRYEKDLAETLGGRSKDSVVTPTLTHPPVPVSDEQYDSISSKLLPSPETTPISKIMFTSPSNGEGSSEIAIQYAHSLSIDSQYKVLLVDAKLANPNFIKRFNIDPAMKGLTDLIKEDGDVESLVKQVNKGNLYILPTGRSNTGTTNILRRANFDNFMEVAGSHFDYVIIDAPPILKSSVSRIISPKVDGVIMVLEANKTRRQVALRAKQELEYSHANILGVILNKRKFHIPKWIYDRI